MYKDKKTIKTDILDYFRSFDQEENELFLPERVSKEYYQGLNSHEKKVFQTAVNELIAKGLLEYSLGQQKLLGLTTKGADLIF